MNSARRRMNREPFFSQKTLLTGRLLQPKRNAWLAHNFKKYDGRLLEDKSK
jgi:hypothetical protein